MDITELKRQQTFNRHPWEIVRLKIIKELIKEYTTSLNHILDVGSGDAYVLKDLCNSGIGKKHTAIDNAYSNEVINIIKDSNCNINYLLNVPPAMEHKADAVLILDVLEHCNDDAALLDLINKKEIVKKETSVFITVPAFQSMFSKHDELLLHYRRYNLKQLKKLCKQNNLQVIYSGYFFTSLLVIRAIQLFLEKLGVRKPKRSIDNWKGSKTATKIICALLWLDFKTARFFSKIGIQLPGLSAYCICRPLPL